MIVDPLCLDKNGEVTTAFADIVTTIYRVVDDGQVVQGFSSERKAREFIHSQEEQPSLDELADAVIDWADRKGILEKGTLEGQFEKFVEESEEFKEAHYREQSVDVDSDEFIETLLMDGIGDTVVTLIIYAHMKGWTLQECLQYSFDIINKRDGEMRDGQFVKEDDLSITTKSKNKEKEALSKEDYASS